MWLDCVCAFLTNPSPTVQQVMEAVHTNQVCTNVQCFESEADAFGVLAPRQGDEVTDALVGLLFAACMTMSCVSWMRLHRVRKAVALAHPS